MSQNRYFVIFSVLCIAQIIVCSYLDLSQYIILSALPLLAISIPSRYSTPWALLLCFAAGFMVDFLGSGTLGMTSCALLPVALCRQYLLKAFSSEEIFTHKDDPPTGHQSISAAVFTQLAACAIFFVVYVWVDAAGTRPFWFNASRFILSTILSTALCTVLNNILFRSNR